MDDVKIPWATWSEDEPSGEVMKAYRAYLRLAAGTNHPGYWEEIEQKRRHDAWVLGHTRAGWTEADASRAWDLNQTRLAAAAKLAAAEKAEQDAREQEERRRRYRARELVLEKERASRAARQAEMEQTFERAGGRARWCVIERRKGRTYASIGREGGLSRERVRQHCRKEERLNGKRTIRHQARAWSRTYANRGRPIDLDEAGPPRDIWLTYYPPADPRLDNMAPVSPQ